MDFRERQRMASQWFVVGGDYTDTSFTTVIDGTEEERIGPFSSYEEARGAWQQRAWATVDSCTKRFRIVEKPGASQPKRFWVIGGDYDDAGFTHVTPGTEEERLGPYNSYEEAHGAWQKRAWATVDSCNKRFRIVEERAAWVPLDRAALISKT
jgi:hypothetical protein